MLLAQGGTLGGTLIVDLSGIDVSSGVIEIFTASPGQQIDGTFDSIQIEGVTECITVTAEPASSNSATSFGLLLDVNEDDGCSTTAAGLTVAFGMLIVQ